jgi:hypothetical protein
MMLFRRYPLVLEDVLLAEKLLRLGIIGDRLDLR